MKKTTIQFGTFILFALATLTFTACQKDLLSGHGSTITEVRTLSDFQKVMVSGKPDVQIIKSNESKIEVTGYANLVSAYRTDVSNGQLRADYRNATVIRNDNISLKIYTKDLSLVDVSGKVEVDIFGAFSGDHFTAKLSGDTRLKVNDNATYQSVRFELSGLSRVFAKNIAAQEASASCSGETLIELTASQKLTVNISGKSDVHYWGNPANVEEHISGLGKLFRRQ